MTKLWTNDGRLILDSSGRLVLCDDCPCETGTGTGTIIDTEPITCGITTKNIPTTLQGEIYDATGEFACLNGSILHFIHDTISTWRLLLVEQSLCWFGTTSTGTGFYDSVCEFDDIDMKGGKYTCYGMLSNFTFICSGNDILVNLTLGSESSEDGTVVESQGFLSSTVITGDGADIQIDLTDMLLLGTSNFFTTPPSESFSILFTLWTP